MHDKAYLAVFLESFLVLNNKLCSFPFLQQADAKLAYQLQAAKEKQRIRAEEIQIQVVERHKQIDIEAKEIERKDKELEATVRKPADAEAYKVETLAEGRK